MITLQHPFNLQTIREPLTQFVGYGGIRMTTVGCSFGKVPVESVLDGTAPAIEVTATSDGRGFCRGIGWHDGDSAESAYVEVYSDQGREFHGWVDTVTRRLVQVG